MKSLQSISKLPKLWLPTAIAAGFVLAPIGNLMLSLKQMGVQGWWSPVLWWAWRNTIPAYDLAWMSLVFISGIFLFRRRKSSWALAIVTLLMVLGINIWKFTTGSGSTQIGFLVGTLGTGVILFLSRFPYIERRENIKALSPRSEVQIKGVLSVNGTQNDVKIVNISRTGCLIEVPAKADLAQIIRHTGTLSVRGLDEALNVIAVRVQESHIGLRFQKSQKQDLIEKLQKLVS